MQSPIPQQLAINAQSEKVPEKTVETETPMTPVTPATPQNERHARNKMENMPDWQREERELKQKKINENQQLLKEQMEERARVKEAEKKKIQDYDKREQERIERDLKELEERYKREESEKSTMNEAVGKKSQTTARPSSKGAAKDQSIDKARDIAAEKFLQAQKEAEELKKNRFKAKRSGSRESEPQPKPSVEDRLTDERPINSRPASAVVDQLLDIKRDLERDRSKLHSDRKTQAISSSSNSVKLRDMLPKNTQLKSVSRFIPVATAPQETIPAPSSTDLDTEVLERLARAKMKRMTIKKS